jgi:hypothetical protein
MNSREEPGDDSQRKPFSAQRYENRQRSPPRRKIARRPRESISNSALLSKSVKPATRFVVSIKLRPDSKTSDKAILIPSGIAVNFSRQKDRFNAQENPPRAYYVTGKFA